MKSIKISIEIVALPSAKTATWHVTTALRRNMQINACIFFFWLAAGCHRRQTRRTTVRRRPGSTWPTPRDKTWRRSSRRYATWRAIICSATSPPRTRRWRSPTSPTQPSRAPPRPRPSSGSWTPRSAPSCSSTRSRRNSDREWLSSSTRDHPPWRDRYTRHASCESLDSKVALVDGFSFYFSLFFLLLWKSRWMGYKILKRNIFFPPLCSFTL